MHILLLEDDLDLGEAVRLAFEAEGYRTVWVRRLADALQQLSAARPDLVVLDLGLPDGDGHELLAWLRREGQVLPTLILSARDALSERLRGLDGGADDFLLKPFAQQELLSRVRALARRSYGLQGSGLSLRGLLLHEGSMRASIEGRELELSPSEFALLAALLKRPDRVLTRHYLEEQVLCCADAQSNVLDVYISSLRRKVGEGYIRTVRGVGYVIDRQPAGPGP
ncbi:response regulator transcription factor [Paucibacter sp. XJ19-41]|uniref:response regulator transcription factor n=1 Tax=Paucibacter sp. XJ19-41 TaxID=2927824 RepID=UPI00234B37D2|nr:response regulator transcription factor [Paucibacter sp. XJ19-41]MDC6167052.1 response regulator transcription factor [Paucibacter sp. XJ19-41]